MNVLVADGALLVNYFRALFAQAAMTARDHHCVDLTSHADLAHVVLDILHHWLLCLAHHLRRVDQSATWHIVGGSALTDLR